MTYNKESYRKYYYQNKEKIAEQRHIFYLNNKKRLLAYSKKKYWKNREKNILRNREYSKVYYKRHPEKLKELHYQRNKRERFKIFDFLGGAK